MSMAIMTRETAPTTMAMIFILSSVGAVDAEGKKLESLLSLTSNVAVRENLLTVPCSVA